MNSPFVMVIFGATGDLMQTKLLPALFKLYQEKKLGKDFYIIGFARRPLTNDQFREMLSKSLEYSGQKVSKDAWNDFSGHFYYQQGFFDKEEGYRKLMLFLKELDEKAGACIARFFYLATPPHNYAEILDHLDHTDLAKGCGQGSNKWTRIVIEKPFGKDLETAKTLDKRLSEIFEEKQIFRVDHYLGKETVQNMLAFRFANVIFEPIWSRNYIDHVQIAWAEERGVGSHGKFFDGVGILRDVAQNHLMQLVAAVAMEQPKSFSKEGVRDVRADAIKAIRCLEKKDGLSAGAVVRGQYGGYIKEKDVSPNSVTETFAAMKLFVDTPRFLGVPFYLRAGKKMPKNVVEISVVFTQTCHLLFKEYGCPEIGNVVKFLIQPNEGITIRVMGKKPGAKLQLGTTDLKFTYKDGFEDESSEAYERLLLDIFAGDQMLFNRSDELESSWGLITNILKQWEWEKENSSAGKGIPKYEQGTWGPKEANELIEKDGRKWLA